ncbi:MAG: hypothetical protein RL441_131 [Actinomycetota bacterium]|jgi:uncharacterized protein with FMN-binding domain
MKRALFVSTGTALGLAATLGYAPASQSFETTEGLDGLGGLGSLGTPTTAAAVDPTVVKPSASATGSPTAIPTYDPNPTPTPVDTKPGNGPKPKATKPPKPAPSSSTPTVEPIPTTGPVNGDFTGVVARAGIYGTVQVQIRVVNGVITDIGTLSYPNKEVESQQLSASAIPLLRSEALAAQSANISSVSGASYTSSAYKASLQAAIKAAGL